jgi:tetratricopeptide (TPR) repeat protein
MSHSARRIGVITLAAGFFFLLPASAQDRGAPQGYKERGPIDMTPGAQRLDRDDVARLESQLVKNPNDLKSRMQLLTHYSRPRTPSARAARLDHIMWLIANRPEARLAGNPLCRIDRNSDPEGYEQARALWLEQVGAHSADPEVIGNAARFMLLSDEQIAEDLLNMCRALDPKNPQWAKLLGSISTLRAARESREQDAPKPELATLKELERTYDLTAGNMQKQLLLAELCKAAFEAEQYDKAASYANQALEAVDDLSREKVHGEALHHGHAVLGRIALMNGQLTKAKEHLLAAGNTPGSPALDSFGPNMSLAKELLDSGESEAVLDYFRLCAQFWKHGETRLSAWTEAVEQGEIPDFGSSLHN